MSSKNSEISSNSVVKQEVKYSRNKSFNDKNEVYRTYIKKKSGIEHTVESLNQSKESTIYKMLNTKEKILENQFKENLKYTSLSEHIKAFEHTDERFQVLLNTINDYISQVKDQSENAVDKEEILEILILIFGVISDISEITKEGCK